MKKTNKKIKRFTAFALAVLTGVTLGTGAWNTNTVNSKASAPVLKRVGTAMLNWNRKLAGIAMYQVGTTNAFGARYTAKNPYSYMSYTKSRLTNQNARKALYYGWGGPGNRFGKNKSKGYALTSLALSYFVSGSSSLGCTDFDSSGLYEFIHYCEKQPNFKTDFRFGSTSVRASLTSDKKYQKTKNIKFHADARTSIKLTLPSKVTLYNVTTQKSYMGKASVSGGQTFYLKAPAGIKGAWKTGTITNPAREYQAYKLQMRLKGFQPIVYMTSKKAGGKTSLKVQWLSIGRIQVHKVSAKTGKKIPDGAPAFHSYKGAVYGIFTRKSCDVSSRVASVTTDSNGVATSCELPQGTYYVKEIRASRGCGLDKTIHRVSLTSKSTNTFVKEVISKTVQNKGELLLFSKSNSAKGAIYTLTSKTTKLIAATITMRGGSYARAVNLPYDHYILKQIKAPKGCKPCAARTVTINKAQTKLTLQ